jgi:hypothetical protein
MFPKGCISRMLEQQWTFSKREREGNQETDKGRLV